MEHENKVPYTEAGISRWVRGRSVLKEIKIKSRNRKILTEPERHPISMCVIVQWPSRTGQIVYLLSLYLYYLRRYDL